MNSSATEHNIINIVISKTHTFATQHKNKKQKLNILDNNQMHSHINSQKHTHTHTQNELFESRNYCYSYRKMNNYHDH